MKVKVVINQYASIHFQERNIFQNAFCVREQDPHCSSFVCFFVCFFSLNEIPPCFILLFSFFLTFDFEQDPFPSLLASCLCSLRVQPARPVPSKHKQNQPKMIVIIIIIFIIIIFIIIIIIVIIVIIITETKAQVQEALEQLMAGRTTLVIAHRLSTIKSADEIVVLEGGHVVERGVHSELLLLGGVYKKLVSAQVGEDGEGAEIKRAD